MFSSRLARIALNGVKSSPRLLPNTRIAATATALRRGFHSSTFNTSSSGKIRPSLLLSGIVGFGVLFYNAVALSEEKEEKGESKPDTIEQKVANVDDLKDGEMKEVQIGEVKILLARVAGKYYATGLKCTHFGAPLNKGPLSGEVVICPWHAAHFNVRTGESLSAPALDGLPVYQVRVDGDAVYVTVPTGPAADRTTLSRKGHLCKCSENRTFVIVGAGAAGLLAAQTIRQDGFKGRVVLITKEDDLPYDRTMLSKVIGIPKNKITLRDEAFFKAHDIEVLRGMEVSELDPQAKKVTFADGSALNFDAALLATGAAPFILNVPGNGLSGVHALRTLSDSNNIIGSVDGSQQKKAVVIGASFIGMEVAAFLRKNKNLDVTVVGMEQVPFERVLGPEVGVAFKKLHEDNGVHFKLGRTVKEITGKGTVDGVVLDDGTTIDADVVVMGVGVKPVTNYLKGVEKDKDGGLRVDSNLRLQNFKDIYVAGDIARFPYALGNEDIRIEHWNVAQDTGRAAGHNMAGQNVPYKGVPFFWTNQFGVGLRFAGFTNNPDEIYIDGSVADRKFVAYYIKDNKVQAVAVMGRDPAGPAAQQLFALGKIPTVEEVKKSSIDLTQLLNEVTK